MQAAVGGTTDTSAPLRLVDFLAACQQPIDAFLRQHGSTFLVHHGPLGALKAPAGPQRTVAVEAGAPTKSGQWHQDFLVFHVRTSGHSSFPNFISLGRSKNNDIVVPDVSLSKFHAFFREEDGVMLLQDAGSRNGTFLDDEPVPKRQDGDALAVASGSRVRFAHVEMTFLSAPQIRELVLRLS